MPKDILVHVDHADLSQGPLEAAIYLAERYNAHLSGIHVTSLFHYVAAHDIWVAGLWEACKDELRAAAERAQESFKKATTRAGIGGEWHHIDADPVTTVIDYGRVVDLIVLGQPAENASPVAREVADKIPLAAGRPVLFVPEAWSGSIGNRVLVAWNNSREAARAVNDALPLLKQAEKVTVMAVDPPGRPEQVSSVDIATHLARHGVRAQAVRETALDYLVGEKLFKQAQSQRADLIVMGAYGHSRIRETMLGGVTRYMFLHMAMPVLMSH
jgi:nucleotide-binding universal stress UspA family protein